MRCKWILPIALLVTEQLLSGCYFVDFFRRRRGESESSSNDDDSSDVLGESLGPKAGVRNQAGLNTVWATSASHAPAAIRPDPDLMARRVLRQFKPEGTALARAIGDVENFRMLLGGAPADFITFPADGYDATSVLANMKVAELMCGALISPVSWREAGWVSILPYDVSEKRKNVTWLLQRLTGVPTSRLTSSSIDSLVSLVDKVNTDGVLANDDYIAPCMAVMIDAQHMFL